MRISKTSHIAISAATLVLGLAACGGSSSNSAPSTPSATSPVSSQAAPPSTTSASPSATAALTNAADPSGQLKFTRTSLSVKAGNVKIDFTNDASLSHNLTIQQGSNGPIVGATPTFQGGTKTLTAKLKPGTYTFFCSVPGHREAGMQGTLVVR